jgi:hypothetical protein
LLRQAVAGGAQDYTEGPLGLRRLDAGGQRLNLACYWLFQIPLAWALARSLGYGPLGVFLAITIAESAIAVVGLLVFRRGSWKTKEV